MKSINDIVDEILAYERLNGKRLSYGDYVWKVQPRLSDDEYEVICKCAERIRKEREHKKRLAEARTGGIEKSRRKRNESDIPGWDW